jgi:hypothetical protein
MMACYQPTVPAQQYQDSIFAAPGVRGIPVQLGDRCAVFLYACCLLSVVVCRMLPLVGCVLAIVYWLLSIVYWLLGIGYWLLAIGYWLLSIVCCLPVLAIEERLAPRGELMVPYSCALRSRALP